MLFHQPGGYRGKIPFELYAQLQNNLPQHDGESDEAWLLRIKNDGSLARIMFGTRQFQWEVVQAVKRRAAIATMADAGATRQGKKGPWLPAQRYMDDLKLKIAKSGKTDVEYAQQAYDLLIEQFDAVTPPNGSIFWNGINELALLKKVDKWNTDMEIFGQLEASTAARYVNKQFVWQQGGVFQQYFTEVSAKLGHHARGHVTAVARCGLRFDSILTTTELPAMLKQMVGQIKAKEEPQVTDITIVVIEPILLPYKPVAIFTNNELANVSIVRNKVPYPGGRDGFSVDGQFALNNVLGSARDSFVLRDYWQSRVGVSKSAAADRIIRDVKSLVTWQ